MTDDRRPAPEADPADAARGRHLARSTLLVMALFVGSKVVGLLRDRAIAARFGVSADYDAYVAAFRVPDLLFTLLAGGALFSAFLPVFAASLTHHDRARAWRLASAMTNLVLLATGAAALAAAVAAPALARWVAPGFAPEQVALTASLMRWLLASTVIFAASGLQMGMLNAFQHFLTPALAPAIYNAGLLVGALAFAPLLGIHGLALGAILGALGHLAVKLPPLLARGARWSPVLGLGDGDVRRVLWLMWPRVVALGTVQAVFLVNTRLASAAGSGALSALNYAWLISQMPQTILGTAVGTVVFPTLAELAARRDAAALRATATRTLGVLALLTLPAAALLAALAGPIVGALLQTGAFDAAAAASTAGALRWFALGLAGHVAFEVVARLFYAQQDTLTPLGIAAAAMGANVALAYALVGSMGIGGLALANSVAVTAEVLLGLWLLRGRLGGVDARALGTTTLAALAAALAAWVAGGAASAWAPDLGAAPGGALGSSLVGLALGGAGGGAAALAVLAVVAPAELRAAWGVARSMRR